MSELIQEKIMRRLTIQAYHVVSVSFGDSFQLNSKTKDGEFVYDLVIPKDLPISLENQDIISSLSIRIIEPDNHHVPNESIMDIFPISAKILGKLGEGTTRTITGVYGMITGVDENSVPVCAFGNSNGILNEQLVLGRAGTPCESDYILCFDAVLKAGAGFSRSGPDAVHQIVDDFSQNIRALLHKCHGTECTESHTYTDTIRPGGKKIALVKLVSGQGAMYDTRFLPDEPSGFHGGHSVIDLTGFPVLLSPNEYRDGAIRAMY